MKHLKTRIDRLVKSQPSDPNPLDALTREELQTAKGLLEKLCEYHATGKAFILYPAEEALFPALKKADEHVNDEDRRVRRRE